LFLKYLFGLSEANGGEGCTCTCKTWEHYSKILSHNFPQNISS